MPPRWVCVAIVASWLGTNGWLLWMEVWPTLQPGQPPPFTIDLVEEVQFEKPPQTPWTISVDGQPVYRAYTWFDREAAGDVYVHHLRVTPLGSAGNPGGKARGLIQSLTSRCRVTRSGDLRGLEADLAAGLATVSLRGEVRDDRFFCHYRAGLSGVSPTVKEGDLDPVPVAHNGALFLSTHPVNRIHGLHPGQAWHVPSLSVPLLGGAHVDSIQARVLAAPQPLPGRGTPCLVIEYSDEDHPMQTWVEEDTGLVLRQDADVFGERWVYQRDR